jgi:23S rRNA (cytosine1962-C5)-methyltransferase
MLRSEAAGKRVLNLFCYTGSFSVYAAAGGASKVTSVDLSTTYLDWALKNFALNGLAAGEHAFIKADALEYIDALAHEGEVFDHIVLDPPTFSNSKMMKGTFDVARDYPVVIDKCLGALAPGGKLWFSTNARKFAFDASLFEAKATVQDLREESIPEDFRDRKIHRLYVLRKK